MEITIPWTPVKALLHLAGKADIRKWVNGVWIDRQGPTLVVWATTGFTLGAIRTEEPSTEGPTVFLPRHIVEACKGFDVQATVARADDGLMRISCLGSSHNWQDENFIPVDWRRVVPGGHCDGKVRQFNVEFLPPFVKVREALKGKAKQEAPLMIAHRSAPKTGVDGLLVQLVDVPEFVGVIMPLNDQALAVASMRTVAPDWVRLHPRTEPAPADVGAELV